MSGRAEVIGCSPGLGLTIGPHMTPFGIDMQASSAFEAVVATMQLPSKTSTATLRMALSIWDVTRLSAAPVAKMRLDFVLVALGISSLLRPSPNACSDQRNYRDDRDEVGGVLRSWVLWSIPSRRQTP